MCPGRIAGRIVAALLAASLELPLAAGLALAERQSGLQVTPDAGRTLISKDVDGERWAIALDADDGTASGNVFFPGGGEPTFVWCSESREDGDEVALSCLAAGSCPAAPCAPDAWQPIGEVSVPQSFLLPPGGTPGTWQALASPGRGARQEHAVVALRREIYVLGGFDARARIVASVEAYDVASGAWRDAAPLPAPMHHANAAAVAGKIYVVGFLTGLDFAADGRTFEYDPRADRWTERAPMPAGTERGASGVASIRGRIFVAGGLRGGSVADFSAYDPVADAWETLPDLPLRLDHLAAGAVNGSFFALGGRGGGIEGVSGAAHAYDPDSRRWRRLADLPTPRGGVAGAVVAGRIFVLGGEGNPEPGSAGVFDDVESYEPATRTWRVHAPMDVPRHGMGAAGLGGRIYVPGGATHQALGAVATFDVLTPEAWSQ